jgi:multidrug efflux pump subunit AcrB
MFPSATINGAAFPTVSSGQAMEVVEEVAKQTLPAGFGYEWTELSLLEKESSRLETLADWLGNPIAAFAGACILVFFVLAGQYESWSVPFAVILVVPMCIFSALIGIFLARMDLNIFVQIGFVVLVGLACKNAILIVEFAREKVRAGEPILEATVDACKLRLRPIVMTSFAFILGVVPLVLAEGAGAEMRKTLGVAVLSGMLGVTIFGIFLTPLFYYLIGRWTDRSKSSGH